MSGLYETFETDRDLENNGVWIDYGDFRVKLAFAGAQNKAFAKYAEAKLKPFRRAMDAGTLSQDISRDLMMDIYAKTVVLGWETKAGDVFVSGIEDKDGSVIPFTFPNVVKTFKALPAVFTDLQEMAGKISNFRAVKLEDEAKN